MKDELSNYEANDIAYLHKLIEGFTLTAVKVIGWLFILWVAGTVLTEVLL